MPFRQVEVNVHCYLHWGHSCGTLLPFYLIIPLLLVEISWFEVSRLEMTLQVLFNILLH